MTLRRTFLLGAAAFGMSMMAGLSPALAIGGNDPIPGIDIIIKKDPGSQPIKPFSLNGGEIKMLNGLKGADRPAFVLKTVAKHIGEDGEFVGSGMKALGDIWCAPCKMVNDISVKFPVGKTTYMLDLHIYGDGMDARMNKAQSIKGHTSRGKLTNDGAVAD
ncbi:hypothetical protein EOK75_05880 [Pseudorhodobacter turbinis]|uniref:Uncharacterized protein n=1 Tax=Pseudorhodobacter turbinis TaxID=2500533 RepID=A0A4P8EFT6_9RHOB|nr:hypothetical protein [Pseudorhodobacter turbinis]QCO55345.1 hypothetical protein EOK75_05880 [Pseudorhodobacter turbinis]